MMNKEFFKMCAIVYGICIGIPLFLALAALPVGQIILAISIFPITFWLCLQYSKLEKGSQ